MLANSQVGGKCWGEKNELRQVCCADTIFSILTVEKIKIGSTPIDLIVERLMVSSPISVQSTPLEIALRMSSIKSC